MHSLRKTSVPTILFCLFFFLAGCNSDSDNRSTEETAEQFTAGTFLSDRDGVLLLLSGDGHFVAVSDADVTSGNLALLSDEKTLTGTATRAPIGPSPNAGAISISGSVVSTDVLELAFNEGSRRQFTRFLPAAGSGLTLSALAGNYRLEPGGLSVTASETGALFVQQGTCVLSGNLSIDDGRYNTLRFELTTMGLCFLSDPAAGEPMDFQGFGLREPTTGEILLFGISEATTPAETRSLFLELAPDL